MAKKIASLEVSVGANVARMQKDLAKMSGHINKWSKKSSRDFSKTWQGMAVGIASVMHIAGQVGRVFRGVSRQISELTDASIIQENAVAKLTAAYKAAGEYTDELIESDKEYASWLQTVTTYGDEQNLTLMALIKNLGVSSDKVQEATQMAIGLATATDRDVKSMAQYVALAMQGEFTMLRRYIPALRTTTDATEQMKIITEFTARGFKVAQEITKTYGNTLIQLRNLYGDIKEKAGSLITENEGIVNVMRQLKEWLVEVNVGFERWIANNEALIAQKTQETIMAIAGAVKTIAGAIVGIYKATKTLYELWEKIPSPMKIALLEALTPGLAFLRILKGIKKESEELTGVIRMKIVKPELPLLVDATPYDASLEFAAKYYLNLKEYSENYLATETERMNQRIAFEQETDAMLLEYKAQYYLDGKALAEQRLKDEITMMNAAAKKEKAVEETKRKMHWQTTMYMISWYAAAFKELGKGSEMAFRASQALSIMESLMKTHEFAIKAAAWASTWGGVVAGTIAAKVAWGLGMVHVAAIAAMSPAAMYHSGGVVGEGSSTRMMPSAMFHSALKLHGGLAVDEYPAVLQRGETVIPADESIDEDVPILQVNLTLDGRELTRAVIHRVEMDSLQLNRLRKAIA